MTLIRFSPSETGLAVCCGGSTVSLWELNLTEQGISKVTTVSNLLPLSDMPCVVASACIQCVERWSHH